MRKLWFLMTMLLAVLLTLTACGQAAATSTPTAAATLKAARPTVDPSLPKMTCVVVSSLPTPDPTAISKFPPASPEDHILGKDTATLTITEYSDMQCPYCSKLAPVLSELHKKYPDDVRLVFRHFPLPSHPLSLVSAQATEAAGEQGKFFEMMEHMYANQETWTGMTAEQFMTWAVDQAKALGLNEQKFSSDMTSKTIVDRVKAAQDYALSAQIAGTPYLLINNIPYEGPRDLASLESIAQLFKLQNQQFTACPPMIIDPQKQYFATLTTEKGDIKVQFFPDKAPMAVNSFVFLAQNGWFDNITFHRVLPNFVAQSGDPSGSGYGGPGYSYDDEISDLLFDKEGMLGMANAGPGSNGSQFFITLGPAENLNGKYTVFGQVIEGMDVVKNLTERDPQTDPAAAPGDKILKVTIEEK